MPKILLIEDETQHTALVKMRLAAQGMQVSTAPTAGDGVIAATKEEPDLILLDLLLPDMTPEKAIRALRAIPGAAKTPIVAFTALDPAEIRRRRLDSELAGVVQKPYESEELLGAIKKILK